MSSWRQFESEAPELAAEVRRVFEANVGHVLATLRRDGSPRVSGIEVKLDGGEFTFGSMTGAMKVLDLRRDPRFALHSQPASGGDAKIAGRAVEVDDPETKGAYVKEVEPPQPFHLFRTELTEVVRTYIEDDTYLVVQIWQPGVPVRTLRRT
jgi:hypothetical protein